MKKVIFIIMVLLALKTGYGNFDVVDLDTVAVIDYNVEG